MTTVQAIASPAARPGCDTPPGEAATLFLVRGYAILAAAMIFLQKFAIPVPVGEVGIDTPILLGGVLLLFVRGVVHIDTLRLALFIAFALAAGLGTLSAGGSWSLPAFVIVILLYVPLCFRVDPDLKTTLRCLAAFRSMILFIAAIVIAQQAVQYTIGNRFWPNLDAMFPHSLLYDGFAYLRPYHWHSPYLKPNGIFFLEPSALSMTLAASVIVELKLFRRPLAIVLLTAATFLCLGGTGPIMLVLAAPLLLLDLRPRTAAWVGAFGFAALGLLFASGALAPFFDRASEFTNPNSSGYFRVMMPLKALAKQFDEPGLMFLGYGAGTTPAGTDIVQWPMQKLSFEYGIFAALLFHAFVLVAMFRNPVSRSLNFALVFPYLVLGGGFVSHATVMPLCLLGSLLGRQRGKRENGLSR